LTCYKLRRIPPDADRDGSLRGTAGGRRGVEGGVERSETDAASLRFVHEPDQLARTRLQPVEIEHDQHVAGSVKNLGLWVSGGFRR